MSQLKMIFDCSRVSVPALPELAEGFVLRSLSDSDQDAYLQLRLDSGFNTWMPEQFYRLRGKALPDGIMVVEERANGKLVATASAETTDYPDWPDLGTLGWVMASEAFRGYGLGKLVTIAAMRKLAERYRTMALSTDDWRHSAVAIYLKLGWRPWLYESDMPERWINVCRVLGVDDTDMVKYGSDLHEVIK